MLDGEPEQQVGAARLHYRRHRRLCALITSPTVGHYLVMCRLTVLWEVFRRYKEGGTKHLPL